MSKSATPELNTAPPRKPANGQAAKTTVRSREQRPLKLRIHHAARWLHIYVSMFGLLSVLFFSVTGITLNHPDWFFEGAQSLTHESGEMNLDWVGVPEEIEGDGESADDVARLEVVEFLRATHGIKGALAEFTVDEFECAVTFKGPAYSADAYIDREDGTYTLTESYAGFVAVMNDLHKGRDAGTAWKWLIDISAVILTLASATGLVLMIYLKKRRRTGLITAVVGAVALVVVYVIFVP